MSSRRATYGGAAAILLLGAAVVVVRHGHDGDRERARAARTLGVQVEGFLHTNPRRAYLSAAAAHQLGPTGETELALVGVALSDPWVKRVIRPSPGSATLTAMALPGGVVTSDEEGRVRTWDRRDGRLASSTRVPSPVTTFASSAGVPLVAAVDRTGGLSAWSFGDVRRPTRRGIAPADRDLRGSVALGFNVAATEVIAFTRFGYVRRVDLGSGRILDSYRLRDVAGDVPWPRSEAGLLVAAAAFSVNRSTGNLEATVATRTEGVARVDLDAKRAETVMNASDMPGPATSVSVNRGGKRVTVGTMRGLARKSPGLPPTSDGGPGVTGVSDTGPFLTAATTNGVWSQRDDEIGAVPPNVLGRSTRALVESPDGLVAIAADHTVELLTLSPGFGRSDSTTSAATFGGSDDLVQADGADPNHVTELLLSHPVQRGQTAWRPTDLREVRRFAPRPEWLKPTDSERGWYVNDVAIDHDLVAAAGQEPSETASIFVWHAKTGRPAARLPMSTAGATASDPSIAADVGLLQQPRRLVAYNPLQELLVTWSTKSWRQTAAVDVGPASPFTVKPGGTTVVVPALADTQSGSRAGFAHSRLLFFDAEKGRVDHEVQTDKTYRVAFDSAGRRLATLEEGGILRIRSADGRRELRTPIQIEDELPRAVAWRPHSDLLAVALFDGGVVLVDSKSGDVSEPIPTPHDAHATSVEWGPHGDVLMAVNGTSSGDHDEGAPLSMWRLAGDALARRACELAGDDVRRDEWRRWVPGGLAPRRVCPVPPGLRTAAVKPRPIAPRQPEIAFEAEGAVRLAGRDGRTVRVGDVAGLARPTRFTWSTSGAVAWLTDDELHVVRPGFHVGDWVPCPCEGAAFAGEDVVALERGGSGLLRFPASGGRPRRVASRRTPGNASLLGAAADRAFMAVSASRPGSGGSEIFSVTRDGAVRRVVAHVSGTIDGPTAVDRLGRHVAFVSSRSGDVCEATDRIGLIDVTSGRVDLPKMPPGRQHEVRSLGFSREGPLHAAVAPAGCVRGSVIGDSSEAHLSEVTPKRVQPTSAHGYDVQLGRGLIATVRLARQGGAAGRLVVKHSSGRLATLAGEVTSVSVRP